ncbi:hypothetical protein RDWZM_001391 [Blomia tropicalis]|uniref:Uncharacterized protein n=1 Tax=Blomia tropicalis TaxID=40697 RepID=A0A9Q0RQK7_BLOTA|nr:hypothetical protein RDWZM_001391 [Blomia tropicalis]
MTETNNSGNNNNNNYNSVSVPIPIANALPKSHRLKRKQVSDSKQVFGKIGGFVLILMLLVMFVAIHSRHNEMVYVALLFVFLAIALFTYGFWSAVSRGDGVWQYIGKHNLQHQQVSNPNYHFRTSIPNYKGHPRSHSYMVAPPKMGGARLQIYTLSDDDHTCKTSSDNSTESASIQHLSNQEQEPSRRHHHHSHHHHHHHHRHRHLEQSKIQCQHEKLIKKYLQPERRDDSTRASFDDTIQLHQNERLCSTNDVPLRPGQSCTNLMGKHATTADDDDDDSEPVKVEVNLSRSASYRNWRQNGELFAEVTLPPLTPNHQ